MATAVVMHLTQEHEHVRQTLSALSHFLDSSDVTRPGASEEISTLLTYYEEIVFLRHEEKEEFILLPELARSGMSWGEGALLHVREEHQKARHLLETMKHGARPGLIWTPELIGRYRMIASEWATFLLGHMAREESEVFPAVVDLAPRSERLLYDFERIDREVRDLRGSEALEAWARDFLAHYSPYAEIVAAE